MKAVIKKLKRCIYLINSENERDYFICLHHYSVGLLTLLLLSGLNLPLSAQTVPTVDPGTPPTIDPGSPPEIIPDLNGTDLNNLVHPNGNIYDQVLMTGRSTPFIAAPRNA